MGSGADSTVKEYDQLKQQEKNVNYVKISKYMSMILRHRPEVIGITLDEHGWKTSGMSDICMLKGNHEYLFERYLQGTVGAELWDACGGSTTRKEVEGLTEEKKVDMFEYLRSLPVYEIVTVGGKEYFLTHSGYNADYAVLHPETNLIDIKESVNQGVKADQERYLFSNDIHYIPAVLKFDKKIIVGHYPTVLIPGHEMYSIFYGEKYFDIDTGNERRDEGGRLACLCLDDGMEYYV